MRTSFRNFAVILGLFALLSFTLKSDMHAYQLFNKNGHKTSFSKMIKMAAKADIILFGELHNNPIDHWLQLELTKAIYKEKGSNLILAAEMFEADNQAALNRYLSGETDAKTFETECRLWPNYKTDYKPLVDFAKENKLQFVAANIPRKYATMVYKLGEVALDTIPEADKKWMTPLPFAYDSTLRCYADIFNMAGGHGGQNLPKSQAIKDATMSHFILQNYTQGKTVIHYNGSYHSNNFQSIYWYLKKANPALKIVTIASTEQTSAKRLDKENKGLADFIILTPESLTKTH